MNYREFADIVRCDLSRYSYGVNTAAFLKAYFTRPGFKITFAMRMCDYLRQRKFRLLFPLFVLFYISFKRSRIKFGMDLKLRSKIGKGLYINHFNCIVIAQNAVIGQNLTVNHGVTIGSQPKGSKKGLPIIGDNVFIACGAKVLGAVKIGNNVAIGANSVVVTDIPDNAVVFGMPARVVNYEGSSGLVNDVYGIQNKEEIK